MGSVSRRLQALENQSREQAVAEIRRAWDRLTDAELVLLLAPFHFGREPTLEESAAEAGFREAVPEDLIARAVAYSETLPHEEVSRRLREVTAPVRKRVQARRDRLLQQLQSLEKAG